MLPSSKLLVSLLQYYSNDEFARHLGIDTTKERIVSLLRSTGRENIETVIAHLEKEGFFEKPASVVNHNNFHAASPHIIAKMKRREHLI